MALTHDEAKRVLAERAAEEARALLAKKRAEKEKKKKAEEEERARRVAEEEAKAAVEAPKETEKALPPSDSAPEAPPAPIESVSTGQARDRVAVAFGGQPSSKGAGKGAKGNKGKGKGKGAKGKGPPARGKGDGGGKGLFGGRGGGEEQSTTKAVMWNTISEHALEDSVWGTVDSEAVAAQLDLEHLQSVFAKKKKVKPTEVAKPTSTKKTKVTTLSADRAKNCEIMLSSIKIPREEVKQALEIFDAHHVLTEEQLEGIANFVPTAEEAAAVKAYEGDRSMLYKADRFFLEMIQIDRLAECLQVCLFRRGYLKDVQAIQAQCGTVIQACSEIRSSRKLAKVLEYVLALGNALNRGTSRSRASGFKLGGLLKFMNTKGQDGKTTLLHYLVATIETQSPELKQFPEELPTVKTAAAMDFASLDTGLQELQKGLARVHTAAEHAPPGAGLGEFIAAAGNHIAAAEREVSILWDEVWYVGAYFGEQQASEEPFKAITTFAALFRDAVVENDAAVARKQKAEERRRAMASRKKQAMGSSMGSSPAPAAGPAGPAGPGANVLASDFQDEMGAVLARRKAELER